MGRFNLDDSNKLKLQEYKKAILKGNINRECNPVVSDSPLFDEENPTSNQTVETSQPMTIKNC